MPESLLRLQEIVKFRGEKPVLRGVDLGVGPGEVHLVLGANGAGKSTLLRIIAGLLKPSGGTLARTEAMAYLGHPTFLYPQLTALQNLQFFASIYGQDYSESSLLAMLQEAGLDGHAKAGTFSRGMAQRLNFCRALLGTPQLFLLDEPFTGMDQSSQATLRRELERRRDQGAAVVLVSHAPEADSPIATHVHVLRGGRLQTGGLGQC